MERIPLEIKVKILKKAIDYNDLEVIKTVSLLNREFAEICYDDRFWYQLYYTIDETIEYERPFYKTWKKTLLKRKRAFTTDELIGEYVDKFLNEIFISTVREKEREEDVGTIIERLAGEIKENIMNFLEGHPYVIHKYQTFWWTHSNVNIDFNEFNESYSQQSGYYGLAYSHLMSLEYDRPIDNIINPYGKLRIKGYNSEDNDINIWQLRPYWKDQN